MSSKSLANGVENMNKTLIDATGSRLRLKDGEGSHVRSLHGWGTSIRSTGKLVQRITKGTLSATEAWTDGRHAEDDKYVELDFELAVLLASATEGAARSTVLKVPQVEPSYRGAQCLGVAAQAREVAFSRKRVSEKVSLALSIHHPSVFDGLGFVFHNFLCPHILGGTSGVAVVGRRESCAACESRFLLKRCHFCCPLGVNQGHGTIIHPRIGGLAGPLSGQWDA